MKFKDIIKDLPIDKQNQLIKKWKTLTTFSCIWFFVCSIGGFIAGWLIFK